MKYRSLDVVDVMWNLEYINSYRINRKMVYLFNIYFFEVKKCVRYV